MLMMFMNDRGTHDGKSCGFEFCRSHQMIEMVDMKMLLARVEQSFEQSIGGVILDRYLRNQSNGVICTFKVFGLKL